MRRCFLAVAVLLLSVATQAETQQIRYRFEPILSNGHRSFHIVVTFRTQTPVTKIVIPTTWGGASHLEKDIQHLTVQTKAAQVVDTDSMWLKEVKAPANTWVTLSYDLLSAEPGPFRHPAEHRAVLAPEYFLFNTENALIYPNIDEHDVVKAVFDWRMLPSNMPFFSSFSPKARLVKVRAPWFEIRRAIFTGGDYRVVQSTQGHSKLVLALRGNWSFSDAEVFSEIRKVIDAENSFWHDDPLPYYLVTLAPFDQDTGSNDGSAFSNAFMLFLSRKESLTPQIRTTLAHETFHHWNPISMGASDGPTQWFTEGFTSYYEGVVQTRAGLLPYSDYLTHLNSHVQDYEMSPLRNLTNSEWFKDGQSGRYGYQLPYVRGASIALWADARIREYTGGKSSLDNVMFDLVNSARRKSNLPALTEDRIFGAFRPYLSPDDLEKLRSYALDGVTIPLPAKLGDCAIRKDVSPGELGFDEASLRSPYKIINIDPESPAYKAGLRNGQKMTQSPWHAPYDARKEVVIKIWSEAGQKEIRYFPVAKQEILLPQYEVNPDSSKAGGCATF